MSHHIKYTSKTTGKVEVHRYDGSDSGAKAWMESLARENECVAEWSSKSPYDHSSAPPTFRASVNGKR